MDDQAPKTKPACPACGGRDVVRILYGLPSPETMKKAGRDEIRLGGCIVGPANPDWACKACETTWPDESLERPWRRDP